MKKIILSLAVIAMTGLMLGGCSESPRTDDRLGNEAEDRREREEAEQKLRLAEEREAAERRDYTRDTETRIKENQKNLSDFRTRMEKSKKEVQQKYREVAADLERRNDALKKKLDEYEDEGAEKWDNFKRDFNREMEELGQAIRDLPEHFD